MERAPGSGPRVHRGPCPRAGGHPPRCRRSRSSAAAENEVVAGVQERQVGITGICRPAPEPLVAGRGFGVPRDLFRGADQRRHQAPDVAVAEQHRDRRVVPGELARDPIAGLEGHAPAAVLDRTEHRQQLRVAQQGDLGERLLSSAIALDNVCRQGLPDLSARPIHSDSANGEPLTEVLVAVVIAPSSLGSRVAHVWSLSVSAAYTWTAAGRQRSSIGCPGDNPESSGSAPRVAPRRRGRFRRRSGYRPDRPANRILSSMIASTVLIRSAESAG